MVLTAILPGGIQTDVLSQWDLGVRLRVSDTDFLAMHAVSYSINGTYFCTEADPVGTELTSESLIFSIPDRLLQCDGTLTVHVSAYRDGVTNTVHAQDFVIAPREKPAGYMYTPAQSYSFYSLLARLSALERMGSSTQITNLYEQMLSIRSDINDATSEVLSIYNNASASAAEIERILSDVQNTESTISRALSAQRDLETMYERADALLAEFRTMQESAENSASMAERYLKYVRQLYAECGLTLHECKSLKDTFGALATTANNAADAAAQSELKAREYASLARINSLVVYCTRQSCTYNTKGIFIDVPFSDYDLSFTSAPAVVVSQPFTDVDSVAIATDITATGFRFYLKHSYKTGTVDLSFIIASKPDEVGHE